jgi:NDP-sugar pyrophosphorylase family protein
MERKRINIVLPIAGRGSRFASAGYSLPKPLIPVNGIPMIEVVVRNIKPNVPHHFIFIALEEHLDYLGMSETLNRIAPGCSIISVNNVTEGAACTVLLAKDLINNENELMIANTDQWVDTDIDNYLKVLNHEGLDGLIMTMTANDNKWSYVGFDDSGNVTELVEKQVISDEATVGIYNFKHGKDFIIAAEEMIKENLRVNGEFYVAPVYNHLINMGHKLGVFNIGEENKGMYGLGIPSDLEAFVKNSISKKI